MTGILSDSCVSCFLIMLGNLRLGFKT